MYNTTIKEKYVLKDSISIFIKKILECIILFLIGMITIKSNSSLANKIKYELYENSFSFTKVNELSKKYLGSFIPKVIEKERPVFNEVINYKNIEEIKDGVKLNVEVNTSIPVLESGMIMMIGDNTITIEQIDGVKTTYTNINYNGYKLYDYLEKGKVLGYSLSSEIDIKFIKEGEKIDYKKYL